MRVWKGEIRRTYPHEPQRANGSTHDSGIEMCTSSLAGAEGLVGSRRARAEIHPSHSGQSPRARRETWRARDHISACLNSLTNCSSSVAPTTIPSSPKMEVKYCWRVTQTRGGSGGRCGNKPKVCMYVCRKVKNSRLLGRSKERKRIRNKNALSHMTSDPTTASVGYMIRT